MRNKCTRTGHAVTVDTFLRSRLVWDAHSHVELEVLRAADAARVTVAPHCFYYGPALNATAEIVAAIGGSAQLEVPFLTWPQRLHPLHGRGPEVQLSQTPGLGFAPDPDVLAEHVVQSVTISL